MKIKALQDLNYYGGVKIKAGEVYEVDDRVGQTWIENKRAVLAPETPEVEVETAAVELDGQAADAPAAAAKPRSKKTK